MVIFAFVVISAALSIYIIFAFERRYEKRARDIEREMEMKERLISLGRLASGMAHEIKNPLNAIGISVQRLKREFLPEEEKRPEYYRFLDIVRAELMRVNKIVEDFLLSTKSLHLCA
jgi:signal transduction histidine kinase